MVGFSDGIQGTGRGAGTLAAPALPALPGADIFRVRPGWAGGRAPAPQGHCLSIVHKPSPLPLSPASIWFGASLATFPGVQSRKSEPESEQSEDDGGGLGTGRGRNGGKRGLITRFSPQSRRNCLRSLSKIDQTAEWDTMALTLPGDDVAWQALTPEQVHRAFLDLCKRFTSSSHSSKVGFMWKRELQDRGAIHYHLLIHGAGHKARNPVHRWLADQWCKLLGVHFGRVSDKHLRWHHHRKNWGKVRSKAYFAKYLGKEETEQVLEKGIGGRWWGFVNRRKIPFVLETPVELPDIVNKRVRRVAATIRRKRADGGKHAAVLRAIFGKVPAGLDAWGIQKLRQGYVSTGRDPDRAALVLGALNALAAEHDTRFGRSNLRGPGTAHGAVSLTGDHVPELARRLILWSVDQAEAELDSLQAARRASRPLRTCAPSPPSVESCHECKA